MSGDVLRIDWRPDTDLLNGRCHCGARHICDDPVAMWTWLLAHPDHPTPPREQDTQKGTAP
ncbi:hypothetical protein ACQB60_40670 [Actinomycetota bacterium Odt1-20B]